MEQTSSGNASLTLPAKVLKTYFCFADRWETLGDLCRQRGADL